jgi:16S rRNA (guanine966-N2)-methyltransferase
MRVIAGTARSLQLETPQGMDTRPTTDRIKETLFNMLQFDLPGCRFLDLFAGSGGIGIEALSRGAKEAVFIDNDKNAIDCITHNLAHTHFDTQAVVIKQDVFVALQMLEYKEGFDIIFMDPPYGYELEKRVLEYLTMSSLISADTLIIFEAALETDISYLPNLGYALVKEKCYKTNKHIFCRKLFEGKEIP